MDIIRIKHSQMPVFEKRTHSRAYDQNRLFDLVFLTFTTLLMLNMFFMFWILVCLTLGVLTNKNLDS